MEIRGAADGVRRTDRRSPVVAGMAWNRVEVVDSKGCSKILVGMPPKAPSLASSQAAGELAYQRSLSVRGPFSDLVICVTGLSKDARKQIMEATRRLGGVYSPSLHPQCTHLVVQGSGSRKLEHALKHGPKNGLFVVTLSWFVDSVKRNVRLSENLYTVENSGDITVPMMELSRIVGYSPAERSCIPASISENSGRSNVQPNANFFPMEQRLMNRGAAFANDYIYVDPHVSDDVKRKIVDALVGESAEVLDCWFPGCHATYVVCEGSHVQKYIGHTRHLVTPSWILKSLKEKQSQRLVHLSADIAREVALVLENAQNSNESPTNFREILRRRNVEDTMQDRKKVVDLAKAGVRNRRMRRMQTCQMPLFPITPNKLLESICWSVSEPTTSAGIYVESCSAEDADSPHAGERDTITSAENQVRLLRESEKLEIVFRGQFFTLLFPIDRFGELGPSSRTFFSGGGFSCIQVLDHIYNFYQECMTADEVAAAIHTDSRHADRLRSLFANKESIDLGFVPCKRIDFLGSRRSFEMLKRVSGENGNIYELVIHA